MINIKKLSPGPLVALILSALLVWSSLGFVVGYKKGRAKGQAEMFYATCDTFLSIMGKQTRSDTSVSKLILVNPDTNVFILSRKTVLPK